MKPQAKHLRALPAPAPIGGLLDPRFVWIPAVKTNVRATFERIRAERAAGRRL